ncbi:hypothetical protein J4421_06145 [Candidatus Woesearchaeota archaeon]|nr:hypothetical protein [Candidatus Woesearchaeota archaeon]
MAKHLKALSLPPNRKATKMRLTHKKMKEILILILGEGGFPLVKELMGKENVSEFDLANKTKQDIKVIRKMLYLLYNNNLVGFTRKKDKQKGWYIYYWTLQPENVRFCCFKMKRDLLQRLEEQLENEKRELFFVCYNSCVRLNFDQAMDFEFHCPECGELITQDEKGKIKELTQKIEETKGELARFDLRKKTRRKKIKKHQKEVRTKKRSAQAKKKKEKTVLQRKRQ